MAPRQTGSGCYRGDKGRKDQRRESYRLYIRRVLKQIYPERTISGPAAAVLDSIVGDLFECLACEASRLVRYSKRQTLSFREIQSAVRLLLPGDLARHAVSEGTKAVSKYTDCQ
ncbi:late histone H2B.L4-like [Rhincodon typus]|uniref:late histone H2B.L4-like n=1 Tax=Rhincodon typus TaxID=259920 RepID=UPI0009A2B2A5|nr:late histone H2B.L4-like [Rhincodon typus]